MAVPNYYETLGVAFDASPEVIRRSFRSLARRFHPDAGEEWPFHFSVLTEAYSVLRDPERRAAYNEMLLGGYSKVPGSDIYAWQSGTKLRRSESVRKRPVAEAARIEAVIGATAIIKGHVTSGYDLLVQGQVHGTIQARGCRLIVAREGRVGVYAVAHEIEVAGSMIGEITAVDRVILRRGARVTGEIHTRRLVIEEGAHFSGKVLMGTS